MKLFEEISGILSGVFMVSSFSKGPAATLPILLICSLIGITLSFFFSKETKLKQKTAISSLSIIVGVLFGLSTSLFLPFLSYWVAASISFFINFIFFRTYFEKAV
jgi:uncharacterized membrane protein